MTEFNYILENTALKYLYEINKKNNKEFLYTINYIVIFV